MTQLAMWAPAADSGSGGADSSPPALLVTPEQRAEAARVIRSAVWRGTMPPSPDRRPWSMGRELHIWLRLVCSGWSPDELTDALRMVRLVNPKVCRLTYLTRLDGPGILADAAQAWRALHAQAEVRPTRELGSISDILAGLGVA